MDKWMERWCGWRIFEKGWWLMLIDGREKTFLFNVPGDVEAGRLKIIPSTFQTQILLKSIVRDTIKKNNVSRFERWNPGATVTVLTVFKKKLNTDQDRCLQLQYVNGFDNVQDLSEAYRPSSSEVKTDVEESVSHAKPILWLFYLRCQSQCMPLPQG